jgi:hypothetical protein
MPTVVATPRPTSANQPSAPAGGGQFQVASAKAVNGMVEETSEYQVIGRGSVPASAERVISSIAHAADRGADRTHDAERGEAGRMRADHHGQAGEGRQRRSDAARRQRLGAGRRGGKPGEQRMDEVGSTATGTSIRSARRL